MKKELIKISLIVLVAMIIGFLIGKSYQKNKVLKQVNIPTNQQRGNFAGRPIGNNIGIRDGGMIVGEVINKDDKSITIKLQDGGSKIVFFSGNTTISKSTQGVLSDIITGSQLSITGETNSDGSLTAQNIQIR